MVLAAQGRSYRLIGREVGLSKNTVADIVKRSRALRPSEDQRTSCTDA
jgi:DNA-binding CsgD family transcriptional regulator